MPKSIVYTLEIYQPDSGYDVQVAFEATTPFQAIQIGDVLDPRNWGNWEDGTLWLRVVGRRHIIYETEEAIIHWVGLFTTAEESKAENRFFRVGTDAP